ncbi:MAG TPA: aromatic amino acid transport family protein, partial [Candidatus Berkiella sp.]|nr:aromatic amino acid transport family protein [Candidatus Berkiella sp.]
MSLKNAVGGVALIAGTAIGAAVLALPVATAHLGFAQTALSYIVCWFFMTIGALFLLEANLSVGYGSNLITMAEKTLGKPGKLFTWLIYLILLYALTAAYLGGLGVWVQQGLKVLGHVPSSFTAALAGTFLTIIVISLGTAVTDWVNRLLMIGLIGAFISLLGLTIGHVDPTLLFSQSAKWDLRPIPLMITAFGSAIVIPSLTEYLHGKEKQLYHIVLIGSLIPLLVYLLWEICIIGIIPLSGSPGLLQIQQQGHPVTDVPKALEMLLQSPKITTASSYFSIFALITSLLGVCLSLFDFLADGLHVQKKLKGKLILSIITFVPPLLFVLYFPRGFTFALSFAGL